MESARRLNPEFVAALKVAIHRVPFLNLLGVDLLELEPGRSVMCMTPGPEHRNTQGTVHGAVLTALVDASGMFSIMSLADEDTGMTTVSLVVNFLSPAKAKGAVRVESVVVKSGRSLGVVDSRVVDVESGRLVASGTVTGMLLPGTPWAIMPGLPRKFLD